MEKAYENMHKYGEEMEGRFSHKPHGNGIVISVTKPFVQEIHIDCHNHMSHEYNHSYALLDPRSDHPEEYGGFYYNTQEKCYYRSDGVGRWVKAHNADIVEHARKCEKLQAHFRMSHSIHKGQLCIFKGYAIDLNGYLRKPSTVDSRYDQHKWFYDPFNFEVKKLDENTVDHFVAETHISKEMTDKMVLHHQEQDKIKRQKEKDDKKKICKEKWKTQFRKINDHFGKYQHFYRYGVGIVIGLLLTAILHLWAILAN